MQEKITVIVPVYNKAQFIERTLKSILAQTYKNLQVIVIDDGSKDNSPQIINDFASRDDRITAILRENKGVSFTRNQALSLSNGEYITFIDADDIIAPNFIERLYFAISNSGADISVVKDTRIKQGSKKCIKPIKNRLKVLEKEQALCTLFSGKCFGVGPCNKMYKRKVLLGENKVTFPEDIYYSEDVPFVLDAFLNAQKVGYINSVGYGYRKVKNSKVTSKLTEKKTTTLDGMDYCKNKILSTGLDKASVYVRGWRALVNFEIFFYMQRDRYFDEKLKQRIFLAFKQDLSQLKKGKKFPLYRRILLPLAIKLNNLVYTIKAKKQNKKA